MTINGRITQIIEKNYDGKLRTILVLRVGTYVNKNQNNELCIFFSDNRRLLVNDFGIDDAVVVDCNTLFFTNDNHRFYNYILGLRIRFDVTSYDRKRLSKKIKTMKQEVVFDADFDYEKMIFNGWTNAGLIEAGYVKKNKL